MSTQKSPIRRAPRGVLSRKPVYMRLMPNERRELDELSVSLQRSTSSVAREVYLNGISSFCENVSYTNEDALTEPLSGR